MQYHYLSTNLHQTDLANFLNRVEDFAIGSYQIVSIYHVQDGVVGVVIRFSIAEPEFNEEEIRRRLGL